MGIGSYRNRSLLLIAALASALLLLLACAPPADVSAGDPQVDATALDAQSAAPANTASETPAPVRIAEHAFSPDTTELTAEGDWTKEDLLHALEALPSLQTVRAEALPLSADEVRDLLTRYPNLSLSYTLSAFGEAIPPDRSELDLSGKVADAAALSDALELLPAVSSVRLGAWDGALDALASLVASHPDVRFSYTFPYSDMTLSSEQTEVDFERRAVTDAEQLSTVLSLLHPHASVDLCGCGLPNETLAALRDRFPERKIVWEIDLGFWGVLRTDAKAYTVRVNRTKAETANRMTSEDIAVFQYCTELIALDLGHQLIEDISCLSALDKLQILILADNRISDLTPIASMHELVYLELFTNRISDLSPLSGLTKLLDLNICSNRISDLKPLYPLKQLERLWYSNNAYTVADHNALCEQIPNCNCNRKVWDETADGWREHPRYFWMMEQFEGWPRFLNKKTGSSPAVTDLWADGAVVHLFAEGDAPITDYCFSSRDVVPDAAHPDWRPCDGEAVVFKSDGTYYVRVRDESGAVSEAETVTVVSGFPYRLEAEGLDHLTEPIGDYLAGYGDSIDQFNAYLAEQAVHTGLYSRAAVAVVATAFVSRLAEYGTTLSYQPSGNYSRETDWGVSPAWGTRLKTSESDRQGVYRHAGLNCSTVIVWAYKQAGLNLVGQAKRFCIGDTGCVMRQNDNVAPLDDGDTGDIIATKTGHVMMILDRVDADGDGLSDSYLVLEMESPYLKLKLRDLHSIRMCTLYRMDAFFHDTGAYRKFVRFWPDSFRIPIDALPAYYRLRTIE